MGRPRKQPRRIMTFNLNEPLADEIDALPIKNRSEWANRVLREVLDNRQETTRQAIENIKENAADDAQQALLNNLAQEPRRLAILLYNSLQDNGLEGYKPKGRYTLSELLLTAINDDSIDSLRR